MVKKSRNSKGAWIVIYDITIRTQNTYDFKFLFATKNKSSRSVTIFFIQVPCFFKLTAMCVYSSSLNCNLRVGPYNFLLPQYMQLLLWNFKSKWGSASVYFSCSFIFFLGLRKILFSYSYSWSSNDIADSIGIPVDILNKRITFWINKAC